MNVKKVLNKYNLEPKVYQDQIFLADEELQKKVVGYADLNSSDTVLEIGAGIGNLTEHISENCEVIAIEKDGKLASAFEHQNISNTTLLRRDIMGVHLENLSFNKIISNFPYSLSTPLTFKLLRLNWSLAVLIYQKEYAERVVACPGNTNYSRLSLAVNHHCNTELLEEIPSDKFYPEPETDSAVVRLEKKSAEEKSDRFWKIVKAVFQHKRKKVKNSLKDSAKFLGVKEKKLKKIEDKLPKKRVYECGPKDFEKIERVFKEKL